MASFYVLAKSRIRQSSLACCRTLMVRPILHPNVPQQLWWESPRRYGSLAVRQQRHWIERTMTRGSLPLSIRKSPPPASSLVIWLQSHRCYWFLPTSYEELRLRWRRAAQARTLRVRLLQDRFRLRYQTAQRRARDRYLQLSLRNHRRWTPPYWWSSRTMSLLEETRRGWKRVRVAAARGRERWTKRYLIRRRQLLEPFTRTTKETSNNDSATTTGHLGQGKTRFPKPTTSLSMLAYWRMRRRFVRLTEYSQADWFDDSGRPLTARDVTGRFVNPWKSESTGGVQSLQNIIKWRYQRLQREWKEKRWLLFVPKTILSLLSFRADTVDIVKDNVDMSVVSPQSQSQYQPSFVSPDMPALFDSELLRLTWLGHATCLLQQQDIFVLTDPMFSLRAGPYFTNHHWSPLPVGIAREVPVACRINDLPNIDVCLLSHDHYDHLDQESVQELTQKNKVQLWLVPLGMADWLVQYCQLDRDRIIELEWWESIRLEEHQPSENSNTNTPEQPKWRVAERHTLATSPEHHPAYSVMRSNESTLATKASTNSDITSQDNNNNRSLWFTCCPTQHWSSRTFFDRNYRLWCSFFVLFPNQRTFYFGGDTALPPQFPLFEQISDYLVGGRAPHPHTPSSTVDAPSTSEPGHIDLAALPIGAYEPEFFMRDAHVNPSEAVQVHQKLRARKSIGIHWGSFPLSEESLVEPAILLQRAAEQARVDFTTIPQATFVQVDGREQQCVNKKVDNPTKNVTIIE